MSAFFFYTGNTGEGAIAALLPEAVHSGIAAGLRTLLSLPAVTASYFAS